MAGCGGESAEAEAFRNDCLALHQPSVLELPLSALCQSALCSLVGFYTSPVHSLQLAIRRVSGPESVCDKSAPETIDTFNQPLRPMSAVALITFDFIKIVCESLLT